MIPRAAATVLALVVLALLVLSVGLGSALLLSDDAPNNGGSRQARPLPTSTFSPDGGAVLQIPTEAATDGAVDSAPAPQSTSLAELPNPTFAAQTPAGPTDTPFPTAPPERVGGPVMLPNNHGGPRWVTLQAGHWQNQYVPEELQHLSLNTGASAAGVNEVDVNVAVAKLAALRLYERGYSVEILDATVPPNYTSDLFLALHADGSPITSIRGFKAVAPWGSVPASDHFVSFLYEEYGKATDLPTDARTSVAMADYYAFDSLQYRHAANPHVPSAILEMGFVTNPLDRVVLATQQERLAWGIANAVDRYFRSGAAGATPSPYPSFTPTRTPTSTLPTATFASSPTSTPPTGTITADGRWLPPLSPNGRFLPPPGSNAQPVLLSRSDDDPNGGSVQHAIGWRPFMWYQYYVPRLGRSIWVKGERLEAKE